MVQKHGRKYNIARIQERFIFIGWEYLNYRDYFAGSIGFECIAFTKSTHNYTSEYALPQQKV